MDRVSDEKSFRIEWDAGASAQLELFSPDATQPGDVYQLKYTPPFRSTLRPPVEQRPLGPGELAPINDRLEKIVEGGSGNGTRGAGGASIDPMMLVGQQLYDLVVPQHVKAELRTKGLFLEIGIDEELLDYPWELMHDGENYLCEKHFLGRFVNVAFRSIPLNHEPIAGATNELGELAVLIVSVPRPQPRPGGETYEHLPNAEKETEAIVAVLDGVPGVTVNLLQGKDATYDDVYTALKSGKYQIVHFTGHANFNDADPQRSGLVLFNRDMTTGPLASFFGQNPPILCFINACETGKSGVPAASPTWKRRYNIYGVARAFLETGSYLLGSRWKLSDDAGRSFATTFYDSLFKKGESLGRAVMEARAACKSTAADNDFGWASYVLYGDPRVCLRLS